MQILDSLITVSTRNKGFLLNISISQYSIISPWGESAFHWAVNKRGPWYCFSWNTYDILYEKCGKDEQYTNSTVYSNHLNVTHVSVIHVRRRLFLERPSCWTGKLIEPQNPTSRVHSTLDKQILTRENRPLDHHHSCKHRCAMNHVMWQQQSRLKRKYSTHLKYWCGL